MKYFPLKIRIITKQDGSLWKYKNILHDFIVYLSSLTIEYPYMADRLHLILPLNKMQEDEKLETYIVQ